MGLGFSITNDIGSCKIYDKQDYFNFEIVKFPFHDGMFLVPLHTVYIFRSLFVFREYVLMSVTSTTQSKKGCKDQESIQSSTIPDPGSDDAEFKLMGDKCNFVIFVLIIKSCVGKYHPKTSNQHTGY